MNGRPEIFNYLTRIFYNTKIVELYLYLPESDTPTEPVHLLAIGNNNNVCVYMWNSEEIKSKKKKPLRACSYTNTNLTSTLQQFCEFLKRGILKLLF